MKLLTMLASLSLIASASQAIGKGDEVRMVAPALDKYAQGTLLATCGNAGRSARDRNIVTLAALVARNQTIEMPFYLNLALDSGVKPGEVSELITHLAFYSGWANAMSAVAVAKDVFTAAQDRHRSAPCCISETTAARRSGRGATCDAGRRAVRHGGSRRRAIHDRHSLPGPVAASGSRASR